jgi:hypothetical protein
MAGNTASPSRRAGNGEGTARAAASNEYQYRPRLAYLEWVEGEWSGSAGTVEGQGAYRRLDRGAGSRPTVIRVIWGWAAGARMVVKKLTITIDDDVYDGLHRVIGARRISRFLNDLARPRVAAPETEAQWRRDFDVLDDPVPPHATARDLREGYRAMAADEAREREAEEWVEGLFGDVAGEPR